VISKVIFLIGPTASGKTDLCYSLFNDKKFIIINADSQQVYKDLPVGTAQPEPSKIKTDYLLYGFVKSGERMNAGRFAEMVHKEIKNAHTKGIIPVVVGGSGLYLNAIIYGLDDLPEANQEIRSMLQKEAEKKGLNFLYNRLSDIDPEYAEIISPNDKIRIIRALEIWILSKKKLGELKKKPKGLIFPDSLIIGLKVERELLYRIINERCIKMIEKGWIEETEKLLKKGLKEWLLSLPAIGYKHIVSFIENKIDKDTMIELIKRDTRHYAKHQITWFKKMPHVQWFEHIPGTISDELKNFLF